MSYVTYQNFISTSGVFWSSVLIYAALTKSPTVMKPCVVIIVIKSTTDLVASIVNYVLTEKIISTGRFLLIISEGPCRSYLICYSSHLFLISLLQQNLIWLACAYVFRYYILYYRDPRLKTFLITAIVAYIPSAVHCFYWAYQYYLFAESSEQHAPRVFSRPEDLVMGGWVVHQSSLVIFLILGVLSLIAFAIYLWIRCILMRFLKKKTSRLSKTAIILNTQLIKAIHFQSFIPLFTLSAILAMILMHYSIIDPFRIQSLPSIFLGASLSIFSLSYVIFMPPYYNFCFGTPKKEVTRMIKSKLKINSAVDIVQQSTTVVYPISTF